MIGTIGNPVLVDQNEFAIKNVALIKSGGEVRNKYLIYLLQSTVFEVFIRRENEGNTQKFLGLTKIRQFKFKFPTLLEQNKIGLFLSKLDNTIALHQRKLDKLKLMKKGLLKLSFPVKGLRIPFLRFTNFHNHWEQRKLREVSERVRGNDGRMNLPTLTISARNGWLDQRDRFSGNIAGKEQKNYTLLSKNELSYNKGNSKLAKYGVVFKLKTYEEALVPRVYHSFRTTKEADSDYIQYIFATKIPDRELGKLITSGARMDGLLNINYDDFMSIRINIPNIKEQIKIGDFIKRLDDTIALHHQKLDRLKEIKKVYLQKMFI